MDQYRCTGINQTNLYYYTVEGVHPVNQGFARIRNAVIGILDGLFALEYEPFGVMTNTGDTEPDEPDTGGDTGDDTPPEEDTAGASIDLTDKFVYDAIIYDCYVAEPNLIGSAGYNASSANVCTGPIALEVGKVYTLTTYWSNSPAYIGLINGAESRGAYVDGAWVANRVGATTIKRSNNVESTETIDGVDYVKMVYSYTPTEPKWLWIGSARANMGMTTLTYV